MNKELTQISQLMNNDYSCKICKRKFGTYQALAIHLGKTECINIELYIRKYYYNNEIPKCICGCGKEVNWNCTQHVYRSMLNGHNWRGKTKENNEIVRIKSEKTQKKLKGRRGHKQTKKTRAKIGIGVSTNWKKGLYDNKITITNGYKNGWYTSSKTGLKYYYQSAWEKDIFCLLDNKKELKWKRHKGAIIYNGCKRYYPDIDVENTKKNSS